MSKKLFEIISRVMNVSISQINDNSGSESIPEWDSFNMYVLLNDIEKEFNIKFSLFSVTNRSILANVPGNQT